MRRLFQSAAVIVVMTTTAAAQPAPAPSASETTGRRWSVSAGYEVFSLRDISRNIRPPDASPISWRGQGPVVIGRYDIERGRAGVLAIRWRRHDFDGYASSQYSYGSYRRRVEFGAAYGR